MHKYIFKDLDFVCGNVKEEKFGNIWSNSGVINMFRSLGELPDNCKDCKSVSVCKGGCRAYAFYEASSLTGFIDVGGNMMFEISENIVI